MTHEATTYRLLEGRGIPVRHFGEVLRLGPGKPVRLPTHPTGAEDLPDAA